MAARLCFAAACLPGARGAFGCLPTARCTAVRMMEMEASLLPSPPASASVPVVESEPAVAEGARLEPAELVSLWQPAAGDRRVIEERHLEHQVNLLAVGMRCKHGCPQAFAYDSLSRPGAMKMVKGGLKREKQRSLPLDHGLFRLSCPHLVKAIDEWEREGAVQARGSTRPAPPTLGPLPFSVAPPPSTLFFFHHRRRS